MCSSDLTLASVAVSPGSGFTYGSIATQTLAANTFYYLVGNVTSGGTAAWANSPGVVIGTAQVNSQQGIPVINGTPASYWTAGAVSGPYNFDRASACFIPVNALVNLS